MSPHQSDEVNYTDEAWPELWFRRIKICVAGNDIDLVISQADDIEGKWGCLPDAYVQQAVLPGTSSLPWFGESHHGAARLHSSQGFRK